MIHSQFVRLNVATTKDSLLACTKVFTKTMGLPCNHAIKARMEKVDDELGRILMSDVNSHWHFKKPNFDLVATTNFTSNLLAINEALAKPLEAMENLDVDANQSLLDIDDIIRDLQANNSIQCSSSDATKSIVELMDDDVDLLDINKPRVAKAKGRSIEARNKKGTMTRAKKAKAKSTRRDPFDFEHVDATIKASRDGKRIDKRDDRDKARQKKQKKPKVDSVAAINADIQALNENMNEIHENIRGIITRQTTRKATKKATATSIALAAPAVPATIKAITKEVIQVSDDDEFDANDGDDADSDDD